VSFAFKNDEIIELLKKRGNLIKQMQYHEVDTLDKKLIKMIKNDEKYNEFTTPVCAFITFYRERGQEQAMNYTKLNEKRNDADHHGALDYLIQHTIFNEIPYFRPAPDPTNIIWENRHISKNSFLRNLILGTVLLLAILLCMFYLIYQLKKTTFANTMKY